MAPFRKRFWEYVETLPCGWSGVCSRSFEHHVSACGFSSFKETEDPSCKGACGDMPNRQLEACKAELRELRELRQQRVHAKDPSAVEELECYKGCTPLSETGYSFKPPPGLTAKWADLEYTGEEKKSRLHVGFDDNIVTYEIPAYSEIYGRHPRSFNFGPEGQMLPVFPVDGPRAAIKRTRYSRIQPIELSALSCEPALLRDSARRRSASISRIYLCITQRNTHDDICNVSDVALRPCLGSSRSHLASCPRHIQTIVIDQSAELHRRKSIRLSPAPTRVRGD